MRYCSSFLCPHDAPSKVLHPGLGHQAQEKCGTFGLGPEEGHKNDQKIGAPLLRRKADGAGIFSVEKTRFQEHLTAAFHYLQGAGGKSTVHMV